MKLIALALILVFAIAILALFFRANAPAAFDAEAKRLADEADAAGKKAIGQVEQEAKRLAGK